MGCITCRMGPRCSDWTFKKIKYDSWSLSWQMLFGVCCSISIVLTAMGSLIIVSKASSVCLLTCVYLIQLNSYIFAKTIYNSLDESYMKP